LAITAREGLTIGEAAHAVALDVLGRVGRGEIPVRNASEAADLVRVLVDVARLDAGQATSIGAVVHVRAGEVDALRAEARRVLGTVALATGDGDQAGPIGQVLDVDAVEDGDEG
jgi:hypothetical protein